MGLKVPPKTDVRSAKQVVDAPPMKVAGPHSQNTESSSSVDPKKPDAGGYVPKPAGKLTAERNAKLNSPIIQEPVLKDAAPGWEFLASHPALALADAEDKVFLSKYTHLANGVARQALRALLEDPAVKGAKPKEQADLIGWFAGQGYGLPGNVDKLLGEEALERLVADFSENTKAVEAAAAKSASAKPAVGAVVIDNYPFFESAVPGKGAAYVVTVKDPQTTPFTVALPLASGYNDADAIATASALIDAVTTLPKPLKELVGKIIVEPNANPDDAYWAEAFAHLNPKSEQLVEPLANAVRPAALAVLKKYMPWEVQPGLLGASSASASFDGEIRIFPSMSEEPLVLPLSLRHELAHTFSTRQRGQDAEGPGWTDWVNAEMSDLAFVSRYSMANPVEDYAETAALYLTVLGTEKEEFFRAQFPGRFNILDREFQDADMNWWVQRKISGAKKKSVTWTSQKPSQRGEKKS